MMSTFMDINYTKRENHLEIGMKKNKKNERNKIQIKKINKDGSSKERSISSFVANLSRKRGIATVNLSKT